MESWGEAYPELRERAAEVRDVLGAEAEQFARTLAQGRRLLDEVVDRSRRERAGERDDAFRLHDTYGFPLDLTSRPPRTPGSTVDAEGFERLMEEQRVRSRAGAGGGRRRRGRGRAGRVAGAGVGAPPSSPAGTARPSTPG